MKFLFRPNYKFHGNVDIPIKDFRYETMLFGADLKFAKKHGGDITNQVIKSLPTFIIPKNLNIVIDTRVNMLMKGYYPSIPGWHCDDIPRGENGQPDLNRIDLGVRHFMVLLADQPNLSGTEFITDDFEADLNPEAIWNSLHKFVEAKQPKTRRLQNGQIISFGQTAIHRASPATVNGWRYFFRLSVTHRKPVNEIRQQVQTYVDLNNVGW